MNPWLSSVLGLMVAAGLGGGPALAHEQHEHSGDQAAVVESLDELEETTPFLFDIGGDFDLVAHTGERVTQASYDGQYRLIFFGYANCEAICPVGLGRMIEAVDILGDAGDQIQPLLITVDPENDTVEALAEALPKRHPRLIGLTGTPEALAEARKAFRVDAQKAEDSWNGKPRYSHGSFIYLMKPDGSFATLLPPVLSSDAMAKTIKKYINDV